MIVGAQWGDEGKGKIVDLLARDSDVVCRYQGGPNAGHTIVVDGETYKFRHMPSGILWGKECVLGAGCVIDPDVFIAELDDAEARGLSTERVRISGNAHVIMPWHVAIDGASEHRLGRLQIGTTRRGIGPAYADKASRLGIRVQDLFDAKILRQKIEVALAEKNLWLERIYGAEPLDLDDVAGRAERWAPRLRAHIADTSLLVHEALRDGQAVLFEGAQGTLLDLDHGTYPFVTSSNPVAAAAATGIGIGPNRIDAVVGVAKAYVTRVGEGPFPTEIEGPDQERVRDLGGEYGTVTGRTRRCGWLDLVAPALRRPAERLHLTGADEARRPLGLRPHPGLHALPPARRDRDTRVPRASERLPPRRAGLRGRRRLARRARRRGRGRRPARRGPPLRGLRRARARGAGHLDRHRARARAGARALLEIARVGRSTGSRAGRPAR